MGFWVVGELRKRKLGGAPAVAKIDTEDTHNKRPTDERILEE